MSRDCHQHNPADAEISEYVVETNWNLHVWESSENISIKWYLHSIRLIDYNEISQKSRANNLIIIVLV